MDARSGVVRIDLGCGNAKRPGYVGLDYTDAPDVDHVCDLTKDRYPFDDETVDEVFSSHFLEHIESPDHVFSELGRIAKDGARFEFWMPYAFSDEALLYGHLHSFTEEQWLHFCVLHRDAHVAMLGGRWLLHRIQYVVEQETVDELAAHGVAVEFAIKYFKGVVTEFGVEIEFRRDLDVPAVEPARVWRTSRYGEPHPFGSLPPPGTSNGASRTSLLQLVRRWSQTLTRGRRSPTG